MFKRCQHSLVTARLIHEVEAFLRAKPVGRCYAFAGCKFPDNLTVQPDVSVLLQGHLDRAKEWIEGPPDWVAEVLDEDDTPCTMSEMLQRCYRAGVGELWMISPLRKAAWVGLHRASGWEALPRHQGNIESEVLEGFSLDLPALFEP